jgi:S-DNA-T family DNA segregation ATPase FtsK/SpoIIIE
MPAIRYTLSAADYVSDEVRAALRRRVHEIVGALLLGAAGIAAVALATWSVQDPSLSHATNAPVRNMLGLTGAISADLMMQLLGIATIAFLFPVAAWGWRLITHRPLDRERTRLALWALGALAQRDSPRACRRARRGRCRPDSAGVVGDALLRAPGLDIRRATLRRHALFRRDRDRHRGLSWRSCSPPASAGAAMQTTRPKRRRQSPQRKPPRTTRKPSKT